MRFQLFLYYMSALNAVGIRSTSYAVFELSELYDRNYSTVDFACICANIKLSTFSAVIWGLLKILLDKNNSGIESRRYVTASEG